MAKWSLPVARLESPVTFIPPVAARDADAKGGRRPGAGSDQGRAVDVRYTGWREGGVGFTDILSAVPCS